MDGVVKFLQMFLFDVIVGKVLGFIIGLLGKLVQCGDFGVGEGVLGVKVKFIFYQISEFVLIKIRIFIFDSFYEVVYFNLVIKRDFKWKI